MARATYQDISPAQNLLLVHTVKRFLMTPNLRFSFITCANPQLWAAIAAYTDLQRLPEADFRVGGRTYSVYGRDWRTVPPIVWLTAITEREFASAGQATSPPRAVEPVHALSRSEFASAVKGALKSFTRPALLASSPLLSSRLVLDGSGTGGDAQRVSVLQALLREAAQELEVAPRTEKLYQALYHTYLHPAPTQERAAEILDLPFSTFRRHLTAAVEYVIEAMWQREDRYSRK